MDTSGNASIPFAQTITVQDTQAPTTSDPVPITVHCSSDVPAPDVLAVSDEADNCTVNPTVTFSGDVSNGGTNPEIITRTYRVADAAGNFINVTQIITIQPNTITTQPINSTITAGGNTGFSVVASNADTYPMAGEYQWRGVVLKYFKWNELFRSSDSQFRCKFSTITI